MAGPADPHGSGRYHSHMNRLALFAFALAAALAGATASARECRPSVAGGWLRMPPVAMPMLAGFARIENRCGTPVTIVAARSPAFADVSLHETRVEHGVSRMRAVPRLRIAPGGAATLAPGGLHLMLMDPVSEPKAGDTVQVEFELEGGQVIRAPFVVRRAGG